MYHPTCCRTTLGRVRSMEAMISVWTCGNGSSTGFRLVGFDWMRPQSVSRLAHFPVERFETRRALRALELCRQEAHAWVLHS